MESSNQSYKSASILIEIIIAIALMALIAPNIINGLITSRQGEPQQSQQLSALGLLKETQESLRIIREKGWSVFSTNGVFHPQISAGTWGLVSGPDTIGDFVRSITISDVYRDSSGNIGNTGTPDPSTKQASVSVSWTIPQSTTVGTTLYLTRYLDNLAYTETTFNQFNAGIQTGVVVNHTNNDPIDGDITLGGGGHGDWCKPNLSVYGFNLSHNASAQAISAIEGRVFAVTGQNNNSETFYDVTISDTNPPIAVASGTTSGQKKAYGVFGDLTYSYLAADTREQQGTIVRLSDYQEVGWLDLQSNSLNGRSITVANNIAYLSATDNKIYIFDITTRTGIHAPIAVSPSLGGVAHKIIVSGSNLYAAVDSVSNQLVILPLTNSGRSFGPAVNISVNGQGGRDIYVKDDGTRVYLATAASGSQPEFFIIDTDPASAKYKNILGSYDTSGMDPRGTTVTTNNKAIIVGIGGVTYQVVDIANDVITNCSGTLGNFNFNIYGIASIVEGDGDAYSYIITSDTTSEFKIIEGGPSGKVGKSGSFESAIFDAGYSTAFNRLSYAASVPSGTTLKFQVAVADPVGNSCTGSTYLYQDLGPSGAIPLNDDGTAYQNPGRCFRYKILFDTTSSGSTPVVYSVMINYSP